MGLVLFQAARVIVFSTAAACAVLLVGGAVKKLIQESGDECIKSGQGLGLALSGRTALPTADDHPVATLRSP
jgi:hypothetical protein